MGLYSKTMKVLGLLIILTLFVAASAMAVPSQKCSVVDTFADETQKNTTFVILQCVDIKVDVVKGDEVKLKIKPRKTAVIEGC